MFRLLFRFFGWLFLAAGFVAIVINGTQSIAANRLIMTTFGATTQNYAGAGLSQLHTTLTSSRGAFIWDPLITHVLLVPTFAILLIIGCCLILLTGKRAKIIGFSSRP